MAVWEWFSLEQGGGDDYSVKLWNQIECLFLVMDARVFDLGQDYAII